ncbi:MAG: hypothetical protein DU489_16420 [Nitrosomonas sp.]|uniref:hypothetical protein n=1 Tax=Nitrosomonas sp. TaxID=42353 RepID=UPI0032ED66C1
MRFISWFFRYYRPNSLVFCLAVIVLGFSFHFLYRIAMIDFITDKAKAEILKLPSINRPHIHSTPLPSLSDSAADSEAGISSKIPKSCFSSDARGCVCYDQHTIVIKDFPVDRCQDIVDGFARF